MKLSRGGKQNASTRLPARVVFEAGCELGLRVVNWDEVRLSALLDLLWDIAFIFNTGGSGWKGVENTSRTAG